MANTVLLEVRDRVAYVTMNRPEKLNAINNEMLGDLFETFTEVNENPDIWVTVLTGAGRAFCTGHDLKQMRAHTDETYFREEFASSGRMMVAMTKIPQPVIARIHGIATAGGCQLVANCDLAVASEDASFITGVILPVDGGKTPQLYVPAFDITNLDNQAEDR